MNQIEILQVKEVQLSEDLVNYDNKKLMEINKALELKVI